MRAFHELVVADLRSLTDDAMTLSLAVPDELAEAYRFSPGQHLTFSHQTQDGEVRRTFSICSTPASGQLTVAVKLLPGGAFSSYVHDRLEVGDTLRVLTPAGRFGPLPNPDQEPRRYVAVAAGSGITPVMSIMASLLGTQPETRFALVYGNRTAASAMFADEITDLKDRFLPRLEVLWVFSQEDHDVPLLSGRIDRTKLITMLGLYPPGEVDEWFLCGPSGMLDVTVAVLTDQGVDRRRVHRELFFTGSQVAAVPHSARAAQTSTVTARLDGRSTTVAMPSTGSVLDAVLAARPDAPFACRGGVCGTCRVRLIEGEVEMARNHALDPQDLDVGFRLACQSVPVTERIVVDFDA